MNGFLIKEEWLSIAAERPTVVQEGTGKVNTAVWWKVQLVPKKLPEAHGTPQRPERKSHCCTRGMEV